ncbi:hypothetical protein [Tritonibacter horizontis]|uniref:DUF4149 domain-containing protein n=1 Tax=Tritonibacter horizontis TaxID=1768241 RepID=A0A132BYD4_9RHOB|nr:hypothetical protein [Tritonibacter horizontis]KUP93409.1 hypothetical protein TRIHO_17500 [Tritonibacter horizontis]
MRHRLGGVLPISVLVWAGVCLGGNLIAAPAKFTVPALDLGLALQVGRAQFHWLGYAEVALAALALFAAFVVRRDLCALLSLAVAVFALQRLGLMPLLAARTDAILAGAPRSAGSYHLLFVGLELLKTSLLLVVGYLGMTHSNRPLPLPKGLS